MSPVSHLDAVGFHTGRYDITPCKCWGERKGVQPIVWVLDDNCVRVVSGKTSKKIWDIIDYHVINVALHGAKLVMVELWHVGHLMEHKVVYLHLPISRMVKCKGSTDCFERLQTLLWVIPNNFHRSVVTLYNKGAIPEFSRICMGVKFQTSF
jgi:hypothetical protein